MEWIDPVDRTPMGEPETVVDLADEVYLGLVVPKTYGGTLGLLAVKCERVGLTLWPVGLAITEMPLLNIDTELKRVQSNPKRAWDQEDGA